MSTSTTRLGLTKPASGEFVSITTLDSNFDLIDAAVATTVGASSARPASAFSGRLWYDTDTGRLKVNTAASASTAASWAFTDPHSFQIDFSPLTTDGSGNESAAASAAYAAAVAAASTNSYFASKRGAKVIQLPAGTFKITSPNALMSDLGTKTWGLAIRGAGRGITNVVFEPAASGSYLLYNNDDWLHITVEDLTFHGSTAGGASGSFMRSVSDGNAQNYVFNRVNWTGTWRYGIDLQGTNNNSEFAWHDCGIYDDWSAYLYSASTGTSDQFLNYNFFATNVEYATGNFIDMFKGGSINMFGGSLIHTGASASPQTFFRFPDGNQGNGVQRLLVEGARVEHRHATSKLIDSSWKRGHITFLSLDTETKQLTTGASAWVTASFSGVGNEMPIIEFIGCPLMGKHSYSFQIQSWRGARRVVYRDCEIEHFNSAHDFLSVTNSDATVNLGGTPPVLFENSRGGDATDQSYYPFDCTVNWQLAKNATPRQYRVSIKHPEGALPAQADTVSFSDVYLPLNAIITNVRFYMPATGSSTSTTWSYTLADSTPTTIASAAAGTQWKNGFNVSTDTWFVCGSETKRHLTLTAANITEKSSSAVCLVTYLA